MFGLKTFKSAHPFPTPDALLAEVPLSEKEEGFILGARRNIEMILKGLDRRLLLIVGPCSIHDVASTLEYADRLQELKKRVADKFFIVMRAYFEKPRTIKGWKGFLFDPDLDGTNDIAKGIKQTREVLVELAKRELPAATELLEIQTIPYLTDLISWGCIGARTVTSQPHREVASGLPFPTGFKNTVGGNCVCAINGMLSASFSHTFLTISPEGNIAPTTTRGNLNTHLVLRGGEGGPNFERDAIAQAIRCCRLNKVSDRIVVDCSHDNSGRIPSNQNIVFNSLLSQIEEGNRNIVGAMLESHLYEGNQPILPSLKYGVSVTDPCLGFEETERLILMAYEKFKLE